MPDFDWGKLGSGALAVLATIIVFALLAERWFKKLLDLVKPWGDKLVKSRVETDNRMKESLQIINNREKTQSQMCQQNTTTLHSTDLKVHAQSEAILEMLKAAKVAVTNSVATDTQEQRTIISHIQKAETLLARHLK